MVFLHISIKKMKYQEDQLVQGCCLMQFPFKCFLDNGYINNNNCQFIYYRILYVI
jgi:hypothetical protein